MFCVQIQGEPTRNSRNVHQESLLSRNDSLSEPESQDEGIPEKDL